MTSRDTSSSIAKPREWYGHASLQNNAYVHAYIHLHTHKHRDTPTMQYTHFRHCSVTYTTYMHAFLHACIRTDIKYMPSLQIHQIYNILFCLAYTTYMTYTPHVAYMNLDTAETVQTVFTRQPVHRHTTWIHTCVHTYMLTHIHT